MPVNSLPAIALATHLDIGYFLHATVALAEVGWLLDIQKGGRLGEEEQVV